MTFKDIWGHWYCWYYINCQYWDWNKHHCNQPTCEKLHIVPDVPVIPENKEETHAEIIRQNNGQPVEDTRV